MSALKRFAPQLLPMATLLAVWPLLPWYAQRLFGSDGEAGSALALFIALILLRRGNGERQPDLRLPALTLICYILSSVFAPQLISALFALLTLALLRIANRPLQRVPPAAWGLLLLALPVLASLQFYLGYPLRVVVGEIAALLLNQGGLAVMREGVSLNWDGTLIAIDVPCSGIKMLWTGSFLALVLAGLQNLNWPQTGKLMLLTLGLVILGNALRVTSLFYIETGLLDLPPWSHEATGLASFILIAAAILWSALTLFAKRSPCPPFAT